MLTRRSRSTHSPEASPCSERRRFLRSSLIVAGSLVCAPAVATARRTGEKRLELHNLHTDEHENVLFWSGGHYQQGGLRELNYLLRDHRSGEISEMDTELIELVHDLGLQLGGPGRFEIISGYRSPATNSALRSRSRGVAKRSLHMQGKAIDLRIPGIPLKKLKLGALKMKRGGVGYYPKSGFVHLDTGKVRSW